MAQNVDLKKMKQIRKKKKYSLGHMAKILGYKSPTGYSYLESGRCKISADQLLLIANEFGISVVDLYLCPHPTNLVINMNVSELPPTGTD